MKLFSLYQELIASPAQLALCAQMNTLASLLNQLRLLWQQETMTDEQLLAELNWCNQQIINVDIGKLNGQWFPYRYNVGSRSISWCLPQGHATEPFQDQYIERCRRQNLFNQLINPCTPLAPLLSKSFIIKPVEPAGFIFHLSRCGSTLLSGCLAELDSTCVLSESPLLTEVLLDSALSNNEKQVLLLQLIHLQGNLFSARNKIIIKWNAWDLLLWPLIQSLYPKVPVVLLIREPVEILASHQRSVGRHMAGDPSLGSLNPVFINISDNEQLLDLRIRVLLELLDAMAGIAGESYAMLLDYAQLNAEKINAVCQYFGITLGADECMRIKQRMTFHSKEPGRQFEADSTQKQQFFNMSEQEKIRCKLAPAYERLSALTSPGIQSAFSGKAKPC